MIFTSKKEMRESLDRSYSKLERGKDGYFEVFEDEQLSFWLRNGDALHYINGDKFKKPNTVDIVKMIWSDCSGISMYGDFSIAFNEEHGLWEIVEEAFC